MSVWCAPRAQRKRRTLVVPSSATAVASGPRLTPREPQRLPYRSCQHLHRAPPTALLLLLRRRRLDLLHLEAQLPRPTLQLLLQPLAHLLGIGRFGRLDVGRAESHQVVYDPRQLVRRRRDRLGRPQTRTLTTQVRPRALELRIRLHAASRRACAARFLPRRVRLDFTLPPVLCQLGHKPSQLAKCFTVGHFVKSVPNSLTSVRACNSSIPSMAVRSTPVA